jgi:tryptophan synthase alpha chain
MNRIQQLFQRRQQDILNIYCTAGYPTLNATQPIILELDRAGADIIELGMPYSDPLADGPTIQASSSVALDNGMSIQVLLEQLEGIRQETQLPIILMGYLNPVLQFGMEAFLERCQAVGIDGLILPDLPLQEYEEAYQTLFEQYGLSMIFLITPQTSEARIRKIDALSNAFIYVVSTAATTGKQQGFGAANIAYFERIRAMQLRNPTLIGFGISKAADYQTVCQYANGAIVGSAFIRMLEQSQDLSNDIEAFVAGLRQTLSVE